MPGRTEEPSLAMDESHSPLESTQLDTDSHLNNETESTREHVVSKQLYEGSLLSTEKSLLVINSYMCHHNLSGQAREDLLELLRLHLPKENQLPPSLYLAQKANQIDHDIVTKYHHYCPHCYILIQECTTLCPNEHCKIAINFESSPYFITISIVDQLKVLLSREYATQHASNSYNYAAMCFHCSYIAIYEILFNITIAIGHAHVYTI